MSQRDRSPARSPTSETSRSQTPPTGLCARAAIQKTMRAREHAPSDRGLELAALATEDAFVNAAESVTGVLFAHADCDHPRGQGTVDIIVTGTAGEATEGLLKSVQEAVDKIAGPYDNILVKSSVTVDQDIELTITTGSADSDEDIENRVKTILTELLAVRRGRKLNELTRSDINFAVRNGYSSATNAEITVPAQDVKLDKDKVITLGAVNVTVERE